MVGVVEVDDPVVGMTTWVILYTLLDGGSLGCVEAQSVCDRVVFYNDHYRLSLKMQTAQEVGAEGAVVMVVAGLVGKVASQVPEHLRAEALGGFGYGRLLT